MHLPVLFIYLFTDYLKMFSLAHIIQCLMMDDYRVGKDMEGSGHCLISNIIPAFAKID
jgi:hypothetical protein